MLILPVSVRNISEWLEETWGTVYCWSSRDRLSDTNAENIKVHGIYSQGQHVCLLLTFSWREGLFAILVMCKGAEEAHFVAGEKEALIGSQLSQSRNCDF